MPYSIRDFLEIKTAAPAGFSPDDSKVLVMSNLTGTTQLFRAPINGGELTPITDFKEPVAGRYLPVEDRILLQMDEGGNERVQIYFIDDDGQNLEKVVHEPDYIHRVGGVTRDGKSLAYASNRRNGVDFDIYVRELASGEEKRVLEMGGWCEASGFSPDRRFLAVLRATERNADNDVYLVDLSSEDVIHVSPHDEEAYFSAPSWLPDSSAFFFSTDDRRLIPAIARYDMKDARWNHVLEFDWEANCGVDWQGRHLLVHLNEDGFTRAFLYDPHTLDRKGDLPLPGNGVATALRFSHDGRYLSYYFVSSSEPGDVWLYETESESTQRLTQSPNAIPPSEFVEPELHRFTSFDRESIPVFLYRPRNGKPPYRTVVSVHGGPESQFRPTFNPIVQYLVHRGYAVAAPNVRGSTGYGKRYHHLDDVYRRLDSVKDLESLNRWLVESRISDPKRIAVMGGSYGGYMTLAALAFQPHLWAAGVDTVGISSFVTFLQNTAAWRRKVREREYGSVERDREFLEAISPLTHVDKMKAPLFIIHGTNDPRVPLGEAKQIHASLTERGIPAELLIYEDEGHGLNKLKNRLDAYPKAVDFLDRVLA